jgi:flagellar hook protein FlgE
MGVLTSLFAGVSGINAAGQQISIIGDNIANVNTPGFKAARGEFQDVLSGNLGGAGGGSQIGAGTRIAGINQNFTQGSLESTGVTTDLSIDGDGFFIVQDATGVFYSRAGMFRLDNQQQLVNEQGQNVLGFGITPAGVPNGALQSINLSSVASVPSATTRVDVNVNLDPNDAAIPATNPFDHLDPVNHTNFQTGIRVFDSLGNPRNILIYFRKDDVVANRWAWFAGANRSDLDMAAYGGAFAQGGAAVQSQFVPLQSGTLTFDGTGALITEDNTALAVQYDQNGDGTLDAGTLATPQTWRWADGAVAAAMAFEFGTTPAEGGTGVDLTTQFGGAAASGINNFVRFMNQDGFSAGSLQSVSIDEAGFVTGNFSNGQTDRLAQVALARFPANQGLDRVGRNNYVETNESGNPIIGSPNQAGFGAVRSGFIEQSNTDLADQFVKLIIAQRAFQANTRTISTTNEMLAQLVQLGS